jgi:hypothetical protein
MELVSEVVRWLVWLRGRHESTLSGTETLQGQEGIISVHVEFKL